jgi:hypothetical protein
MATKRAKKPSKPEPRKLRIDPMDAVCCFEKGFSSGHLHMTMDRSEVTQGEKKIGSISNIMGGGIAVRFEDGWSYHLSIVDIMTAVHSAHERWKDRG